MPVEIPDLWSDSIRVDVQAPLVILRAQDEAISRKTQGILRTEVTTDRTSDEPEHVVHTLELLAPALGYRESLLEVKHRSGKPYPVTIVMPEVIDWSDMHHRHQKERRCSTPDEFVEELRAALQSEPCMNAILNLLALSNEEKHLLSRKG